MEARASTILSPNFSSCWFVVESGLSAGVWTVDTAAEYDDLELAALDASVACFGSGAQGETRARAHWRAVCHVNARRALDGQTALSCGLLDAEVYDQYQQLL
jgi:hypothetical protein